MPILTKAFNFVNMYFVWDSLYVYIHVHLLYIYMYMYM